MTVDKEQGRFILTGIGNLLERIRSRRQPSLEAESQLPLEPSEDFNRFRRVSEEARKKLLETGFLPWESFPPYAPYLTVTEDEVELGNRRTTSLALVVSRVSKGDTGYMEVDLKSREGELEAAKTDNPQRPMFHWVAGEKGIVRYEWNQKGEFVYAGVFQGPLTVENTYVLNYRVKLGRGETKTFIKLGVDQNGISLEKDSVLKATSVDKRSYSQIGIDFLMEHW